MVLFFRNKLPDAKKKINDNIYGKVIGESNTICNLKRFISLKLKGWYVIDIYRLIYFSSLGSSENYHCICFVARNVQFDNRAWLGVKSLPDIPSRGFRSFTDSSPPFPNEARNIFRAHAIVPFQFFRLFFKIIPAVEQGLCRYKSNGAAVRGDAILRNIE